MAPLPIQFADYALWERQHPQEEWDRRISYWRRHLQGNLKGLKLPLDRARPKTPTLGARRVTVFLPPELKKAISELGRAQRATQFMVLLAGFQQFLHLCTGQVDIVVGASVANRQHAGTAGVIGCFSNLIVLRCDLSGDPTFLELLKRVRNTVLEGDRHQGPVLEPANLWSKEDDSRPDPVNQFRFSEAPDSGLELAMGDLEVEVLPREQVSMGHDFRVLVGFTGQAIELRWDYNTDLFDAETIRVMLQGYQSLLEQIVLNPNRCLRDFSLDLLDKDLPALCRERSCLEAPIADGAEANLRSPEVGQHQTT
jgi:non-ribosomal peptide synthetase component F